MSRRIALKGLTSGMTLSSRDHQQERQHTDDRDPDNKGRAEPVVLEPALAHELYRVCEIAGDELVAGAKGIAEGGPPSLAGKTVNKFRPGGLMIVRAGGDAGMFSGILGGWSAGGPRGSLPVTKEVKS